MSRVRTILLRLVGLFVDDWPTTILLAVWLVLCAFLVPRLPAALGGAALFAGLAIIVVASVVASARRAR